MRSVECYIILSTFAFEIDICHSTVVPEQGSRLTAELDMGI